MANFDAGNFPNLKWNVGGPSRFNKAPAPEQKADVGPGAQEKGPRDEVNFGAFTLPQASPEVLQTEQSSDPGLITAPISTGRAEQTFSPSGLLDLNTIGSVDTQKWSNLSGLTALNGLNSTSLTTVGGVNVASASALNPVAGTRMKTTSVSTNGIEDTMFTTSSGRILTLGQPAEVRMPTTSVTTFGLEDSSWLTTSGRTITLA